MFALTKEGEWNIALQAPKLDPVNCVASQKYTGLIDGVMISASTYILCIDLILNESESSPSKYGHGLSVPRSGLEYAVKV